MKTFEFEGKRYKEAHRTNSCDGCAFKEADVSLCKRVEKFASQTFDGGCLRRDVIFVLDGNKPTPYAWAVTGCSQLFTGEYAEHDAKAWQKHIGGNTEAFPLYRIKENEK